MAVERRQLQALLMRSSLDEHFDMMASTGEVLVATSSWVIVGARFRKMVDTSVPVLNVGNVRQQTALFSLETQLLKTHIVAVSVVTVSVVKEISTSTTVDVTVANSVTVVVAGVRDSHDEQNDSPASASAPTAAKQRGEPHDAMQPALAKLVRTPALRQRVHDFMLSLIIDRR